MTPDEERLLEEYQRIKTHGWGKLDVSVQKRSQQEVSIIISAGKAHRFIVRKDIED